MLCYDTYLILLYQLCLCTWYASPWFDIDLYNRGFDPNSTGYFVELTDGSTTKSFMSSLKDSDKNKSQHWRNLNSWVAST